MKSFNTKVMHTLLIFNKSSTPTPLFQNLMVNAGKTAILHCSLARLGKADRVAV